jgi:hypothetical protein
VVDGIATASAGADYLDPGTRIRVFDQFDHFRITSSAPISRINNVPIIVRSCQ